MCFNSFTFPFSCFIFLRLNKSRGGLPTPPRRGGSLTPEELEYFRNLLRAMLEEAQRKGDSTLEELTDGEAAFADPADRATAESDRSFTLRIRDRERRLIHKIQEAIKRMDDGVYGVCEECGEDIGVARLKARPVTTLCVSCKARQEEGEDVRGN